MSEKFSKSRKSRTPVDYVVRILTSTASLLVKLRCFDSEAEFVEQMLNPLGAAFDELNAGGRSLQSLARRIPVSVTGNDQVIVDDRREWALRCCWSSLQALFSFGEGEENEAWTYVVDAQSASDALRSRILDGYAVKASKSSGAVAAALVKLAKDPRQQAKPHVRKLWQEWNDGTTLYESDAAFDRHIVVAFPEITSTKTVERWRLSWKAESKQGRS